MLTIGTLAKRTGTKVQTIRYYETIGLMPEPERTEGGQRRYSQAGLDRLAFVRHGRQLGFSLEAIRDLLETHRIVGVPYSDEMIENAVADFSAQADPDSDYDGLLERYGDKVQVRNFDGLPGISEADALIAYLQMLGTLVDFSTFTPDASR